MDDKRGRVSRDVGGRGKNRPSHNPKAADRERIAIQKFQSRVCGWVQSSNSDCIPTFFKELKSKQLHSSLFPLYANDKYYDAEGSMRRKISTARTAFEKNPTLEWLDDKNIPAEARRIFSEWQFKNKEEGGAEATPITSAQGSRITDNPAQSMAAKAASAALQAAIADVEAEEQPISPPLHSPLTPQTAIEERKGDGLPEGGCHGCGCS